MTATGHHPDLARRARFVPRWVIRPWSRGIMQAFAGLSARRQFPEAERLALSNGELYLYRPEGLSEPAPAMLWIHGGGRVGGDARQDGAYLVELADTLGIIVGSVQYRLAPGHHHPAPLDDCVEAFETLAALDDVDASQTMVGGASAGGGFAASVCQRLKGAVVSPGFQLLIYPMLDDRSSAGSGPNDHLFRLWDRTSNVYGWESYLGDHPPDPPAVAGRLEDLSGLPPAWIGVGTADLFHDEDVAYAERLRQGGVEVELVVIDGAYHAFDVVDADAPVTRSFIESQHRAIRAHLDRS